MMTMMTTSSPTPIASSSPTRSGGSGGSVDGGRSAGSGRIASRGPREKRGDTTSRSRSPVAVRSKSTGSSSLSPKTKSPSSKSPTKSVSSISGGGGAGSLLNPLRFRSWSNSDKKNFSPVRPTRTKSNDSNASGGGDNDSVSSGGSGHQQQKRGLVSSVFATVRRTASGSLSPMRSRSNTIQAKAAASNTSPKRTSQESVTQKSSTLSPSSSPHLSPSSSHNYGGSSSKSKSNNTKSKKKGVKFDSSNDQVYKVLPRLSSITIDQKKELWFTKDEFNLMYDDCDKTVERMENGKLLKDKKYTSHGLEGWTNEGHYLRKYDKEDAWDAVLDQQYKTQKTYGRRISTNVSLAYQQVSKDAKQRAIDIAKSNHNDVNRYILKDIQQAGVNSSLRRLIDATEYNLDNLNEDTDDKDEQLVNASSKEQQQREQQQQKDTRPPRQPRRKSKELSVQDMNDLNELIRQDLRTQTRTGAFDDGHSSLNEITYFMQCLDAKSNELYDHDNDDNINSKNKKSSSSKKSKSGQGKASKPKKHSSTSNAKQKQQQPQPHRRAQRRRSSF